MLPSCKIFLGGFLNLFGVLSILMQNEHAEWELFDSERGFGRARCPCRVEVRTCGQSQLMLTRRKAKHLPLASVYGRRVLFP